MLYLKKSATTENHVDMMMMMDDECKGLTVCCWVKDEVIYLRRLNTMMLATGEAHFTS